MHDMSRDVFVFIEQRDGELQKVGIELLGKSKELAETLGQKVVAMLVGANIKSKAETLIHHGADKVIVIENEMLQEYVTRSEEHTSELQSRQYLVCRLLLEKKKTITYT